MQTQTIRIKRAKKRWRNWHLMLISDLSCLGKTGSSGILHLNRKLNLTLMQAHQRMRRDWRSWWNKPLRSSDHILKIRLEDFFSCLKYLKQCFSTFFASQQHPLWSISILGGTPRPVFLNPKYSATRFSRKISHEPQ